MRAIRFVRRTAARAHRSATIAGLAVPALVMAVVALLPGAVTAQEHEHDDGGEHADHHTGLHLTHPLFTESVSPDTKLRLDWGRRSGNPGENEMELEGELAFGPAFSIEAGIHYHLDESKLGDTHVLFKLANAALAESGVHLGYGLELGIPTGPGHEHAVPEPGGTEPDESWEVAPFVNAGWTDGTWELVAWSVLAVPTDRDVRDIAGTGLRLNGSVLYHLAPTVEALLEAFGTAPLSGSDAAPSTASIAPGLRLHPVEGPLMAAAGIAFPVAGEENHIRLLVSVFYHF